MRVTLENCIKCINCKLDTNYIEIIHYRELYNIFAHSIKCIISKLDKKLYFVRVTHENCIKCINCKLDTNYIEIIHSESYTIYLHKV